LDQYYSDHGIYPPSLKDLVEKGYLRAIPEDPITRSKDSWVEVFLEGGDEGDTGVYDIHSGSDLVGTDSIPYHEW
jgi:general secretion pathway protein G